MWESFYVAVVVVLMLWAWSKQRDKKGGKGAEPPSTLKVTPLPHATDVDPFVAEVVAAKREADRAALAEIESHKVVEFRRNLTHLAQ